MGPKRPSAGSLLTAPLLFRRRANAPGATLSGFQRPLTGKRKAGHKRQHKMTLPTRWLPCARGMAGVERRVPSAHAQARPVGPPVPLPHGLVSECGNSLRVTRVPTYLSGLHNMASWLSSSSTLRSILEDCGRWLCLVPRCARVGSRRTPANVVLIASTPQGPLGHRPCSPRRHGTRYPSGPSQHGLP